MEENLTSSFDGSGYYQFQNGFKKLLDWDFHIFGHFLVQVISFGLMGRKGQKQKQILQNQSTGILTSLLWI